MGTDSCRGDVYNHCTGKRQEWGREDWTQTPGKQTDRAYTSKPVAFRVVFLPFCFCQKTQWEVYCAPQHEKHIDILNYLHETTISWNHTDLPRWVLSLLFYSIKKTKRKKLDITCWISFLHHHELTSHTWYSSDSEGLRIPSSREISNTP